MAKRKINLMHTVLRLGVAGLERLVTELTLGIDRERFDVEVCCFAGLGPFADLLRSHGIPVTLVKQTSNVTYLWQLRRFFRERRADIVHTHTGTFFYAALAAKLAGVPAIVYTEHGRFEVDPLIRLVEDYISVRVTDKVVAVSDQLQTRLIEQVHFPASKVLTIVNGINTDQFAPRPEQPGLRQSLSIPDNAKIVGTVGRLQEVKDHLSFIKAFELVNQRLPNTVLMLVGDGSLRPQLEAYVADHNLKGRVIFAGLRQDIPEMLNLLDLFVLSSLSEGTCVSLLEAMASGLPAVVTDVGGNPSIVTHGVNGLVVEPRDIEQLANAIVELLTDEPRYARMSENARQRMVADFSSRRMMEKYNEIYSDLLSRKRVI